MLDFETVVPDGVEDGAPLVVLLHGRGADRFDLVSLAPLVAPGAVVVCPDAPHPGAPWGYGPGRAWYRFLGGATPEPESFEAAQRALADFLAEVPSRLPVRTGPTVLGGFSQGGTMSVAYALRNPGAVPMAANLSGFLADHPTVAATGETVRGTRFFWGHGTMDPAIPFQFAVAGRAALLDAGADLTARDYPIGHAISQEEAADLRAWIDEGTR
jgi:phospholipase/carboxylesterase